MNREQLIIGSQARLVEYLQNELNVVRAERDKLKERVSLLESVFIRKLNENEKTYRDLEASFNRLERLVYKTIKHECKIKKRPVTYDEILKAFFSRHPFLKGKVKTETVTRRVRKLKEDGFIISPKTGYFCPKMEV